MSLTLPVERTATKYHFAADGQGVITIASCLDQSKRSSSTTVLCSCPVLALLLEPVER
jgi:hypothetical protein